MSVNIWGVDPKGKKAIYFLRCPSEDLKEELKKARKEGWTGLATTTPDENWPGMTPIQTIPTTTTPGTPPTKKRGRPRAGPRIVFAED